MNSNRGQTDQIQKFGIKNKNLTLNKMDKEQVRRIMEQYSEHTLTKEFFKEVKKYYDTIEIVYDEYPNIYYVSELNKTIFVGL